MIPTLQMRKLRASVTEVGKGSACVIKWPDSKTSPQATTPCAASVCLSEVQKELHE